MAFNKSRYEKHLATLRQNNAELFGLKGYIQDLGVIDANRSVSNTPQPEKDQNYREVQQASEKLYELLLGEKSKQISPELQPTSLKLCLEAREIQRAICLDLIICCSQASSNVK